MRPPELLLYLETVGRAVQPHRHLPWPQHQRLTPRLGHERLAEEFLEMVTEELVENREENITPFFHACIEYILVFMSFKSKRGSSRGPYGISPELVLLLIMAIITLDYGYNHC